MVASAGRLLIGTTFGPRNDKRVDVAVRRPRRRRWAEPLSLGPARALSASTIASLERAVLEKPAGFYTGGWCPVQARTQQSRILNLV